MLTAIKLALGSAKLALPGIWNIISNRWVQLLLVAVFCTGFGYVKARNIYNAEAQITKLKGEIAKGQTEYNALKDASEAMARQVATRQQTVIEQDAVIVEYEATLKAIPADTLKSCVANEGFIKRLEQLQVK